MNIHEMQLKKNKFKLEKLLQYSKENIPFYMNIKKDPAYYVDNYNLWLELPIVKKEYVQKDWTRFVESKDIVSSPGVKVAYTSGSTGTPLKIIKSLKNEIYLTKKLWKTRQVWNKDIMDWRLLYLYRNIESSKIKVLRIGDQKDYLDLSEKNLINYLDEIEIFEPQWMIGPPIGVTRLAMCCNDNYKFSNKMKMIEVYGELLLPYQRNLIERTFGCKVANHYGAREFGVISYECPYNKMHAWEDEFFLEVLKDGNPVNSGEEGELFITALNNRIMPLIRYKIGDIVKLIVQNEPCKCGNESSIVLEPVDGRISDLVFTTKKIISTSIFDTLFSRFIIEYPDSVREFQVIQKSERNFEIQVVAGVNFSNSRVDGLVKELEDLLDGATVSIVRTDIIKNMSSGKTLTFIPLYH
jgi:Coenzyme F390 synthetase